MFHRFPIVVVVEYVISRICVICLSVKGGSAVFIVPFSVIFLNIGFYSTERDQNGNKGRENSKIYTISLILSRNFSAAFVNT